MPHTPQELKEWFEANYLDGDKIQQGQMLSSSEAFEAVKEATAESYEGAAKICEGMRDKVFPRMGYTGEKEVRLHALTQAAEEIRKAKE